MIKAVSRLIGGTKKRVRLFFHPLDRLLMRKGSHIHFIGIGGIGMSAIAFILKDRGYVVSGSDMKDSKMINRMMDLGISVQIGHREENISPDIDVVVVSSAIPKNNPEIERALSLGIPIVKRSLILGYIMKGKRGVAISGTHGKTTTTTMLSLILDKAGLQPTALIGGEVKNIGGNFIAGKGDIVVAEACEYDRSFLDLFPYVAVITNIEADHLDYYSGINEIKNAFRKFISKIPEDGLLVIPAEDHNAIQVAESAKCKVVAFGFSSRNQMSKDFLFSYWEIEEVNQKNGESIFTLSNGRISHSFSLKIPGKHNISNACAAIIVADFFGVDAKISDAVLREFTGTNRRFQIKGNKKNFIVVDDYAHHPTEIRATLDGVKKFYNGKKILAIFEPHQYSRTHMLLKDFGMSFGNADMVIVPDIYAVRDSEEDKKKVSALDLAREIEKNGVPAKYISSYEEIVSYVMKEFKDEVVVITLGAGNVYKIGEEILDKI